jgi:hypothetical protein
MLVVDHKKDLLTDRCNMIGDTMLRSFFPRNPCKFPGQVASRLSLQEVVEVANRICHKRVCSCRQCKLNFHGQDVDTTYWFKVRYTDKL